MRLSNCEKLSRNDERNCVLTTRTSLKCDAAVTSRRGKLLFLLVYCSSGSVTGETRVSGPGINTIMCQ